MKPVSRRKQDSTTDVRPRVSALLSKSEVAPDNPQEAFRQVVYGHGVKALAGAMLTKPGTLYNKADADDDSHNQPTLRDVVRVTQITGNLLVLDSLERMFGRVAYDVSPGPVMSDAAILELLCQVGSENGAMHRALLQGLEDGKFSREDLAAVRQEAHDLIAAVLTLAHRLEGLVDD